MAKNNEIAARNQKRLAEAQILGINLIGSPGCGKTTLLESMASILGTAMFVIEGDVQTRRDADRIERAGCAAYQIETGGACHLNAQAVSEALDHLEPKFGACRYMAIENVGNLICPSAYDLGEHVKVGLLSVPEGDDKVLKYPSLFSRIDVLLVTKIDLLPVMEFNRDRVKTECRSLQPDFVAFELSGKTGQGVEEFCEFLDTKRRALLVDA
jgi:hydrogenase nickel incorporation protein HypB